VDNNKTYTVTIPDEYDTVVVHFNNEVIEIRKNVRKISKSKTIAKRKETEPRNAKGTELYVFLTRKERLVRVIGTTSSRIFNEVRKMVSRVYKDYGSVVALVVNENGDATEGFRFKMKEIDNYSFDHDHSELERFKEFIFSKPYCRLTPRIRNEVPSWKLLKISEQVKEYLNEST